MIVFSPQPPNEGFGLYEALISRSTCPKTIHPRTINFKAPAHLQKIQMSLSLILTKVSLTPVRYRQKGARGIGDKDSLAP